MEQRTATLRKRDAARENSASTLMHEPVKFRTLHDFTLGAGSRAFYPSPLRFQRPKVQKRRSRFLVGFFDFNTARITIDKDVEACDVN